MLFKVFFRAIKKSSLPCLACLLLFGQNLFAQGLSGTALSDALFSRLKKMGFDGQKEPLSSAWFAEFPYNIQVKFSASQKSQWTFFITIAQEDAWSNEDFFSRLLSHFKSAWLPCDLTVVLTAGDKPKISGNEKMAGSEIFCKSIEGSQNSAALVLDFRGSKNVITPGSDGEVSPYYLTRLLSQSFDKNSCPCQISGGMFLALYRLNALKSEARLSSFLKKEIPALLLSLPSDKSELSLELNSLKDFFSSIEAEKCADWSRHYFPIKLGSKRLWINETDIMLNIFVFMSFALFILTDFAFLFRKRSHRLVVLKIRAILSNYIIIFSAALLALSFFFGQYVAKGIENIGVKNPMALFSIKLIPAFLFISTVYPLELLRQKKISTYLYEYILSTSAILNIFIFTFIDISFFYLFALEYLILVLSRVFKRSAFLFIFLALFALPFLPLIFSILVNSNPERLNRLIYCGIKENVFLAFALVPFNLIWLRILARMNVKKLPLKSLFLRYFILGICAIVFLSLYSIVTIKLMEKFFFQNVEPSVPLARIEDSLENKLSTVTIFDTQYYGATIRRIEINCEQEPERFEIIINSSNANPIYFSVYESETVGRLTQFLLPDKPPKSFTLQYSPDFSDCEILTQIYFMQEKKGQNDNKMQRGLCARESFSFVANGSTITERQKQK